MTVAVPWQVYLGNAREFPFRAPGALAAMACPALLASLLLTAGVCASPRRLRASLTSLLVSLAALAWLQAAFLTVDYGVLNGVAIDWSVHARRGWLELGLWGGVVALATWKARYIAERARQLSVALLMIQLVSGTLLIFGSASRPQYALDYAGRFEFSSSRNVIVLVVDSFQTDLFQQALTTEPSFGVQATGFTYFRNSVGGFSTTFPSLALMLSDRYYDNSVPILDFINAALASTSSLPRMLRQQGWRVDLYPYAPHLLSIDPSIASNASARGAAVTVPWAARLLDVALFRAVPHLIKRFVYNDQRWLFTRLAASQTPEDLEFFQALQREGELTDAVPRFKLLHIRGMHPPLEFDEHLVPASLSLNRADYVRHARGNIRLLAAFLAKLKEIGVYDNSVIVIVGDHGSGIVPVEASLAGIVEHDTDPLVPIPPNVKAAGTPLILVKPAGASGPLTASNAPVSLGDVPRTVSSLLGVECTGCAGSSMFEVAEGADRDRRYYHYDWGERYLGFDQPYLPPMHEYKVSGFSWFDASWHKTRHRFGPGGARTTEPTELYRYGTLIEFGEKGNVEQFDLQGWHWGWPEAGFSWTTAPVASLSMKLPTPRAPLVLVGRAFPFTQQDGPTSQVVTLRARGEPLAVWRLDKEAEFDALIPPDAVMAGRLDLTLDIPAATSPRVVQGDRDSRLLGIGVRWLLVKELSPYRVGELIRFGQGGDAERFQGAGWGTPEPGFTWTVGERASLIVPLPMAGRPLALTAALSPLTVPGQLDAQHVRVSVGGRTIADWRIAAMGEYSATIPPDLAVSPLKLVFDFRDAASPADLGLNGDPRRLAVGFERLALREDEETEAAWLRDEFIAGRRHVGANLLVNGDFRMGRDGWQIDPSSPVQASILKEGGSSTLALSHAGSGDWRAVFQVVKLRPSTWYLYEARIKSTAPVVALAYEVQGLRWLEDAQGYGAWQNLTFIFRTPAWGGLAKDVGIYPVLFRQAGRVWLQDVRLAELSEK